MRLVTTLLTILPLLCLALHLICHHPIFPSTCASSHLPTPLSSDGPGFKPLNSNGCLATLGNGHSLLSCLGGVVAILVVGALLPSSLVGRVLKLPFDSFEVIDTHRLPLSYLSSDPVVCSDIQRREDRSRRTGGIGAAVVLLQCGRISQVMPVEVGVCFSFQRSALYNALHNLQVDPPAKVPWASIPDWEDLLSRWIDGGRGEFVPPINQCVPRAILLTAVHRLSQHPECIALEMYQ